MKNKLRVVALQSVNPFIATTRDQLVQNVLHQCQLIREYHTRNMFQKEERKAEENYGKVTTCSTDDCHNDNPVLYVLCEMSSCTYDEQSFLAPLEEVTELVVSPARDAAHDASGCETVNTLENSPSVHHFGQLARELQCYVCFGFQRRLFLSNDDDDDDDDGRGGEAQRTVAQCVINSRGSVELVYNKQHLCTFGDCRENLYFVKGACTVDTDLYFDMPQGIRVGMSICYDFRFPEHFRQLALLGCDLVLHPASFPIDEYSSSWPMFSSVRALENQFYVLTVNMLGHSMVTPPWIIPNRFEVMKLGDAQNDFLSFVVDKQAIEQVRTEVPLRRDSALQWPQ